MSTYKLEQLEQEINRKNMELRQAHLKLIDLYVEQWKEINASGMWEDELRYKGNAYGLKEDSIFIFQINGPLPRIIKQDLMDQGVYVKKARNFIVGRLSSVCRKMSKMENLEKYKVPVAIIIVHYYNLNMNRVFDMDNKEKSAIINTLRGVLYKEDTVKEVSFTAEIARPIDSEPMTMVYVGPTERSIYMLQNTICEYPRIDNLANVIIGDAPRFVARKYKNKIGSENSRGDESTEYKNFI